MDKKIQDKISYEEFMKQMDDVNVSDVFKEKQWLSYCSEFRPHINNVDLVSLAEAYRAIDRVRERS
jgi:hypothetical protein